MTLESSSTITGLDGKLHPRQKTTGDDRMTLIGVEHNLHHMGKTVRQIQAGFATRGIRRSLGTISADLNEWTCSRCSGGAKETPEQALETAPEQQASR